MSDEPYERNVLVWSAQQAERLRRRARGELVDGIDWTHVAMMIAEAGLSDLNAVCNDLRQMMVRVLKIHAWPDSPAVARWRAELIAFQADAAQCFTSSMRPRIDLARLYARALSQVEVMRRAGGGRRRCRAACPFRLDQLLHASLDELEACPVLLDSSPG